MSHQPYCKTCFGWPGVLLTARKAQKEYQFPSLEYDSCNIILKAQLNNLHSKVFGPSFNVTSIFSLSLPCAHSLSLSVHISLSLSLWLLASLYQITNHPWIQPHKHRHWEHCGHTHTHTDVPWSIKPNEAYKQWSSYSMCGQFSLCQELVNRRQSALH